MWHGERYRHGLSAKRVKTSYKSKGIYENVIERMGKFVNSFEIYPQYQDRYMYEEDDIYKKTFFHGTSIKNFESIKKYGLRPFEKKLGIFPENYVYMTTHPKGALNWINIAKMEGGLETEDYPIVLRINFIYESEYLDWDKYGSSMEDGTAYKTIKNIKSENIDILVKNEWKPIKEVSIKDFKD